jgi:5'(3')-deoxyribonucleotidase
METSKRRPTIAIDVDGVLRNNLGILVKLYNNTYRNVYHKNLDMTVDDVKKFKVEESFPLIEEMVHIKPSDFFFHLHAKDVFLDAPAYTNIKECINRLKEVADVVIVTYQKDYTNKRYTLEWLEKNGIEPNGICFVRDKTLVHTDALIDDNDYNFLGTHCGTAVLVTQPYNKDINLDELITKTNSKQIVRVDSFEDFTVKYLNGEIVL